MVNVLAAIGVAQMETFSATLHSKKNMDCFYRQHLKGIGDITFQANTTGDQSKRLAIYF